MKKIFLILLFTSSIFAQSNFGVLGMLMGDDVLPETKTQQTRILADGGTIVDLTAINDAIKHAKSNGYYTNLKAWYSSRFAVKKNANNKVTKIYDISGNNYDVAQTDTSKSPTYTLSVKNGLPSFWFDGGDRIYSGAFTELSQPNIIICVFKAPSDNAVRYVYDGIATGKRSFFAKTATENQYYFGDGTAQRYMTLVINNTWQISGALHNGASGNFRRNGSSVNTGNAGNENLTGVNLGNYGNTNTNYHNNYISEYMLINNNDVRTIIEIYLNSIWAVY